jgi:uncharacterized membrane protein YkoI
MSKKLLILAAVSFIVGTALIGKSFAGLDDQNVKSGTIKLKQYSEADFPDLAKILPGKAIQAVLARMDGKLLKLALEDENGFLAYAIELVTPDKNVVEFKVDAGSGEILTVNRDSADNGDDGDKEYDD